MHRSRSFSTPALVLTHRKVGEQDRLVVLITQTRGKLAVIAKGVRKLTSSRKATLEPGNIITAFCIETKSMPILTQAKLQADCHQIRSSLHKLRQLSQVLEMFDRLLVEEELDDELFELVLEIRNQVVTAEPTKSTIFTLMDELLVALGYQPLAETKHSSIMDYVAEITEKPLKSWEFLRVG